MPTEQRRSMAPFHLPLVSESSFFIDEFRLRPESQVGVLKQGCFPENYVWGNKPVASSPLETIKPIGAKVVDQLDNLRPYKLMAQKTSFVEDKLMDKTRHFELPPSCWRDGQDPALQRDSFTKALAFPFEGRRGNFNGTQNEKELFSSSLPDIFDKKIRLTPNSAISGQLAEKVNLNHVDDEPFELTKEIEAQIIGNLLPDDDDLLSGVVDGVGYTTQTNNQDDIDDIFYTGGGMELEGNDNSKLSEVNGVNNGQTMFSGHFIGEHKYEGPPSRTLLVRNIDSNVEDYELKLIFERYGDICTLYTDSKHHGFVMISYYDVRSAENALKSLQGKLLGCRKLDICYSNPKGYTLEKDYNLGTLVLFDLDPSVTGNDLHQIFVSYGEIKEIAENGNKKFIVFYDVRAAEAARRALNRSDILEKRARMERSYSGATNRVMQQMSHELEQKRFGVCRLGNPSHPPSTCFGSVNMAPIMSPGPENGTVRNLSSRVQAPTNQFREGRFLDLPSTTIKTISSPVGITSAGTQSSGSTHSELSHSLGTMNEHTNGHINYGFQESTFPHSLPESQNGLNNDIPYNLSTITPSGTVEAMFSRHIYKGVSRNLNTNSSGHIDALDFSRVGSCPLHNHQLAQNYSYDLHHQPSSRMLWPRATPFINNVPSRPLAQVHGISTPPQVPESILPINHHQVGSAPAVHPPNWDRRRGYPGEMIEASGFFPGSAGSMGFPGSPQLHELELNRVFSQTGGAFMEPMSPVHMGTPPRQRGHMFHGRSRMISHPSSFDSPGERMRSRRNESGANQSDDRRQFELDVQRIARGEDTRTTLMIKNIPNKYTSKMLLSAIDETHKGTYDFIYLPIDFKNRCNVGYAFINIISPEKIIPFYKTFNGKRWDKFNSEKVASLAYARIQGKSALIAHFQNSSLMNEDKRCRPILFHSDGPNAGDQEPFPVGTNVRTRPGRARILGWEESGTPQRGGETPGSTTVA